VRDAPTILHADLDAFYASAEQLLDPSLRGRPVAVGGSASGGVVLAASYEARRHGVKAPMPGWQARRLCPDLVFVGGNFREYQRLSKLVMAVFEDVTPLVEQVSIDEAFLDVHGAQRLFGSPEIIARNLRERVRTEIGLPLSIGVATTKHLAKIASQVAKPDGLVVVPAGGEEAFLEPLPIGLVWGIGKVTESKLHDRGIRTIGQLGRAEPDQLVHLLGKANGTKLHERATNSDERSVTGEDDVRQRGRAKSVGAQSALGRRRPTPELLQAVLGHLADRVGRRMRAAQMAGRTITVRVRFADMRAVTRSTTLPAPLSTTLTLTDVAVRLAESALADHPTVKEISLLGLSVSHLVREEALQLELAVPGTDDATEGPPSAGSEAGADRWAVDRAMDRVRSRFGGTSVGYLAVAMSADARVPDEFRELAEHDL
jgi:DNA polymerase IV